MAEFPCTRCKEQTKYVCTTCEAPICKCKECSFPEINEDSVGWIAQRSVAYCKDCGDDSGEPLTKKICQKGQKKDLPESQSNDDYTPDEADIEV